MTEREIAMCIVVYSMIAITAIGGIIRIWWGK